MARVPSKRPQCTSNGTCATSPSSTEEEEEEGKEDDDGDVEEEEEKEEEVSDDDDDSCSIMLECAKTFGAISELTFDVAHLQKSMRSLYETSSQSGNANNEKSVMRRSKRSRRRSTDNENHLKNDDISNQEVTMTVNTTIDNNVKGGNNDIIDCCNAEEYV
jgi:hypothetical protein